MENVKVLENGKVVDSLEEIREDMKRYVLHNDCGFEKLVESSLNDFHPDFSERLAEIQKVMGGFDDEWVPTEKFEDVCDNIEKYLLA